MGGHYAFGLNPPEGNSPVKKPTPINSSARLKGGPTGTLFGTRISTAEQLKGALVLSVERALGNSYAPMYWVYGPRGRSDEYPIGEWPVKGVCPVAWAFAGVLYTQFPGWLRDELFAFSEALAGSETDHKGRQQRLGILGRYAITESFRLQAFDPIRRHKRKLLELYEADPAACSRFNEELLNRIKAPNQGLPLLSTLRHMAIAREEESLPRDRNSILEVGEVPALVAAESPDRKGFLDAWVRAVAILGDVLAARG